MNVPYDSRNSFYRSPMGAVEEGTQIHFKILVPRSLNCVNADLSIKHDFDGDWTRCNMFWCGTCGDGFETWEATTRRKRLAFTGTASACIQTRACALSYPRGRRRRAKSAAHRALRGR